MRIKGLVQAGDGRGRQLGFPTANLAGGDASPAGGVYVGWAFLEGRRLGALVNVGTRPTFAGTEKRTEVHLLDFVGDLYGKELEIDFIKRLRDEQRFGSVQALKDQLAQDLKRARAILEEE